MPCRLTQRPVHLQSSMCRLPFPSHQVVARSRIASPAQLLLLVAPGRMQTIRQLPRSIAVSKNGLPSQDRRFLLQDGAHLVSMASRESSAEEVRLHCPKRAQEGLWVDI